ncbi:MAG: hypothetical protein KA187_05135, partial [Arenimonas sp.]|nr:hypothetical protein [Arenimonas sp.]
LKWIEQVMEKNNLEASGPMRIVTNEFSTDTYGFDVVMPVRRKGAGPALGTDVAAEGEDAEAAPAEVAAAPAVPVDPNAPLELLNVTVEGPVAYVQIPAMRVATTTYTGPSPGLPRVRDLVRAWAMVRGAETTDRPFEEYLGPLKNMLDEDAEFRVFWPLQVAGQASPVPVVLAPLPSDGTEAAPAEGEQPPAAEAPVAPAAG